MSPTNTSQKVRSLHWTSSKQILYTPKRHTTAVKYPTFTTIVILWSIVNLLQKHLVDQTPTSNFLQVCRHSLPLYL